MYYHVSLTLESVKVFEPRIPELVYTNENKTIPRISVSDSIEGCLTAVPWGGRKLEDVTAEFAEFTDSYSIGEKPTLYVRVYEFSEDDIQSENIIPTETLLHEGLVMDAEGSDEHWIVNQTVEPSNTYIIGILSYEEEVFDVFSKEYHLAGGDVEHLEEHMTGIGTKITDLQYETVNREELPYDETKWEGVLHLLKENAYETL